MQPPQAATDAPAAPSTLRRLAVNATALAVGGLIAQLCFLLVEALIARRLGRADYGVLSTVYAISLTSVYFFELGMGWKVIQDGSRDPRRLPVLLGTSLAIKLVLAGVVYAALLLVLPLAGYPEMTTAFFAVFFAYPASLALQDSLAGVNSARQQMHINALYQASTPVLILGLVALVTQASESLIAVGWAYVLAGLVITSLWTWQTFRAERPRVELAQTLPILRGSYLYGVSGLLYQMSYRVEVVALSLMRGMVDVALFAAADRLTDVGMKVAIMGTRVVSPVLFHQSEHDPESYVRSCRLVLRGAAILGAVGGLVLAGIAEPLIVGLFGERFRASALVLMILAPSVAARFAMSALRLVLTSSDQHARRVGSLAGGVGAAIVANIALIPKFGILGAASARLAGDLVQFALMLLSGRLPVQRHQALWWVGGPLVLAAAAFLAAGLAGEGWLRAPIALLVLGLTLVLTGSIRIAELRELGRELGRLRRGTRPATS